MNDPTLLPDWSKCPGCGGTKFSQNDLCIHCRRLASVKDEEPKKEPDMLTVKEYHAKALLELQSGTTYGVDRAQVYATLALSAPTLTDQEIADGYAPPG